MKNYFKHKFRKKSPLEIVAIILFGGAAIIGLAILFGFVIMWLWNWLMPDVFGLPTLTYWQAVGLFILLKILVGGGGGRGGHKKSSKKECKDEKGNTKSDFSKWKHYNKFWEEEGEEMYEKYMEKKSASNIIDANSDKTEDLDSTSNSKSEQ